MDASSHLTGRDGRCVDDKVPDLAEEDVRCGPCQSISAVLVAIDQAEACVRWEVGGSLDCWWIRGIAYELCVEVIDDGIRDDVCSERAC